jgi:uncharacterized lipoprotein YmbA
MRALRILLAAPLALLVVPACLAPHEATARFFEPGSAPWERAAPAPQAPIPLNLQRVQAPGHLARPMAWRRSEVELAFDEVHRWAAEPAAQVEETLLEALFLEGPFTPSEVRGAARLEVRLAAYEGLLEDRPAARVALVAILMVSATRTETRRFDSSTPILRSSPEALAHGIGVAQRAAVTQLRAWLSDELEP